MLFSSDWINSRPIQISNSSSIPLGTGPIFTSLLLYYLLLFFPGFSSFFYFSAILVVYLCMSLLGRKQFYALWKEIAVKIKKVKCTYKNLSLFKRIEYIVFPLIIIILLTSFLIPYITTILQLPLEETDALKYGTLGKIFFEEKSLEYRWIRVYPKTGYYLINNHAPSFSLFLTWEKIIDSLFRADANKDIYYKSISGYYALLILSVFIYWISKKSKYLALLGVFLLLSGTSFFFTLFQQHLDSYRLFFLILSWIFLAFAIEKKRYTFIFLAGNIFGLGCLRPYNRCGPCFIQLFDPHLVSQV